MVTVVNELLVDEVGADALGAEATPHRAHVLAVELGLIHELVGVLSEQEQLTLMRIGN